MGARSLVAGQPPPSGWQSRGHHRHRIGCRVVGDDAGGGGRAGSTETVDAVGRAVLGARHVRVGARQSCRHHAGRVGRGVVLDDVVEDIRGGYAPDAVVTVPLGAQEVLGAATKAVDEAGRAVLGTGETAATRRQHSCLGDGRVADRVVLDGEIRLGRVGRYRVDAAETVDSLAVGALGAGVVGDDRRVGCRTGGEALGGARSRPVVELWSGVLDDDSLGGRHGERGRGRAAETEDDQATSSGRRARPTFERHSIPLASTDTGPDLPEGGGSRSASEEL